MINKNEKLQKGIKLISENANDSMIINEINNDNEKEKQTII